MMQINQNFQVTILFVVSTLLSFYTHSLLASPVLKPVSLQLKWPHQFQFADYYAAKEMGYYTDEGLSVEIRENSETKKVINQVVNSEANFGVGGSALLVAYGVLTLLVIVLIIVLRNYFRQQVLLKSIKRLNLAYGTTGQSWFDLNVATGEVAISDDYT
jgi:ABC-type nitrate/sulfonate/bicarbonate transport system substrate-binding protein